MGWKQTFLAIGSMLVFSAVAHARVYDLYRADYPKGAFCDAIGGACAADGDLENAFFQNPATLATGTPDWNFDGELSSKSNLEPGMAQGNSVSEYLTDGGIGYSSGKFGLAVSMFQEKNKVEGSLLIYDANNLPQKTKMSSTSTLSQWNIALAARISPKVSLALTTSFLNHKQDLGVAGAVDKDGSEHTSTSLALTAGTFYSDRHLKIGSWLRLPTTIFEQFNFSANVASTVISYREDFALRYPWLWATGIAFEPSRRYSIYFQTTVVGPTANGYLLSYDTLSSAVGDKNLVAKGRQIVVEPHWGGRVYLSRKLTLHLGGFYETSRWEGYNGRLHTSGGLSLKLGDIVELIGGIDYAKHFTHVFFTFR